MTPPEPDIKRLTFSMDLSRCSGCMACVVACMDHNDLQAGTPGFRQVERIEDGAYPSATISFVSLSCFNCENAPCVTVCPTGAVRKRGTDGVVQMLPELCIGCRSCLLVCPFGAPVFLDGRGMGKCESCTERVDRGMEPPCVRVCPTRALGFGRAAGIHRVSDNGFGKARGRNGKSIFLKGIGQEFDEFLP